MDLTSLWSKIPRGTSTDFKFLSWQARGIMSEIWRQADRQGDRLGHFLGAFAVQITRQGQHQRDLHQFRRLQVERAQRNPARSQLIGGGRRVRPPLKGRG